MSEQTVGVAYCGGCNPRYDRVAAVERLKTASPGSCFEHAQPGEDYGVLLVVCGCPVRCASAGHLTAERKLVLDRPEAFETAVRAINLGK